MKRWFRSMHTVTPSVHCIRHHQYIALALAGGQAPIFDMKDCSPQYRWLARWGEEKEASIAPAIVPVANSDEHELTLLHATVALLSMVFAFTIASRVLRRL